MRKTKYLILLLLILCGFIACDKSLDKLNRKEMIPIELGDCEMPELPNGYKIMWCDEFNYEGSPDSSKWSYDIGTGNGGWGNSEAQYYTNRLENVYVSDGTLKIKAMKESYQGSNYTSSRIVTRNKGDFKYGFFEIRAILPTGVGTWPAIWMLPTDNIYGTWPNSGEIDIMEAVGRSQNSVLSTLHTASNYGGNGRGRTIGVKDTSSSFNLYQFEWTEDYIKFYVNGNTTFLLECSNAWKTSENGYKYWPFDQEFHLLLNVAMGGTLGGNISSSFVSSEMIVDYVRIYQKVEEDDIDPSDCDFSNYYSTSSTINLEWLPVEDNIGIRYYEIILDNKQHVATTRCQYTITNLKQNTEYRVLLIAVDWQGNYSVSSKYMIKTKGITNVPNTIKATDYEEVINAIVVDGSKSEKILKFVGNSSCSYSVNFKETSNYDITINASILRKTIVKIYLENNNNRILIGEKTLSATYGKYDDIVLVSNTNIEENEYVLIFECTAENVNSVLLDYIDIKKTAQ